MTGRIVPERIADDLWKLVCVPSPTRRERDAALLYAELLSGCGVRVEVDESIHDSPSVIGRLSGGRSGPTLQLAGHIDHIDVAHEKPSRTADIISGRGSADMKAGLASILEIARLMADEPDGFPGELLITVYGLHEAPLGKSEGLTGLIEKGIKGDAALVMEGPPDAVVVCGKGQSIWNITLEREGIACHELRRKPQDDLLLEAAMLMVGALRAENESLSAARHPLLGPESFFIGQLHYGDFYNRSPRLCMLQGTRRWHPDKNFTVVRTLLDRLVEQAGLPPSIRASVEWTFVGESFAVDPGERIVQSMQEAARRLRGGDLPVEGVSSVLDTSRLVPLGHVPCVPIDCDGSTAHADREFVRMPEVVRGCALALETALCFLRGATERRR